MQYQTFSGSDLKEALGAVRAAYGPDALIGPTRHVQVQGQRGVGQLRVEVQAAPSTPHSSPWPFASALLPQPKAPAGAVQPARAFRPKKQDENERAEAPRPAAAAGSMSRMEAQINELRAIVESLQAQLPARQRVLALLGAMGIEGSAARALGGRIGKAKSDRELTEKLRLRILKTLPRPQNPLTSGQPELVACVGPTGVGKTTTLAKLAAQARLDHSRSVAVINLDHYRVGAGDQWARYGKLMGIPVFTPKTADELGELLSSNLADFILVDTPSVGSAPEDPSMRAFSQMAHRARRNTHVLLLLPAWLRGNDAERMVSHYQHQSPTGLVVTKLDEQDAPGGIVQAALASSLPIQFLCRGPKVPEHLEAPETSRLIDTLFARIQSATT
jgi:flagellar biosynthesis protein FlhF